MSLAETSSRVQKSNTTFTSSGDPFLPFHKIRNANLVDPSVWFRLVTVVVKVPPARLGVSTVYIMEPVSESRMVVLRISSSSFRAKVRFILRGVGSKGDGCGGSLSLRSQHRRIEPIFMAAVKCINPKSLKGERLAYVGIIPPVVPGFRVASTQNWKRKGRCVTSISSRGDINKDQRPRMRRSNEEARNLSALSAKAQAALPWWVLAPSAERTKDITKRILRQLERASTITATIGE